VIFAAIADWADERQYPVVFMCEQLGVSESGYYAWRSRPPSDRDKSDASLVSLIRAMFVRLKGNPGRRRIRAELAAAGHRVSHKRVHRLMQAAGLQGRHSRPWKRTTVPAEKPVTAPDLVGRDFTAAEPDTKWCGDITYVKTWKGWVYLATVIDLHSRKAVGWAVADHMRTSLVTEALTMALTHRKPPPGVIFHSDRGSQYTSAQMAKFCAENSIRRSMGRTGICYDNAVAESFFASYKKELVHTRPWPSLEAVRTATFEWVETYYNRTRRHSSLGYLTPDEYELGYRTLDQIHELAA